IYSITASTVPTGTVLPASTRIAFTTPFVIDGISVVTLSVSTSNSGSSPFTGSPTFFCHFAAVPSVPLSPSWGMIPSLASPFLAAKAALHFRGNARRRRDDRILELVGGGQRNMRRRDANDRALELAENLFLDDGGDLGAPAAQPRILLDREHASRAGGFREY